MLIDTRIILSRLTRLYPPMKKCPHSFTVRNGHLTLTLMLEGRWQEFKLDRKDEQQDASTLIAEVSRLIVKIQKQKAKKGKG